MTPPVLPVPETKSKKHKIALILSIRLFSKVNGKWRKIGRFIHDTNGPVFAPEASLCNPTLGCDAKMGERMTPSLWTTCVDCSHFGKTVCETAALDKRMWNKRELASFTFPSNHTLLKRMDDAQREHCYRCNKCLHKIEGTCYKT